MAPMIEASKLGKRYRKGGRHQVYRTLREDLLRWRWPFGGSREHRDTELFWALKDVSFTLDEGEVVGLIGANGAGKSTLLRIIARITRPTEGHAHLYGRVGSLLEVGIGLHPELTGRENIFVGGTILGMRRAEVAQKLDEIVDFSEIQDFLDTPVKHYSTGMYLRLAFAVAAHLEPEILLVDEVLAVGDVRFQKKCLGRMEAVARGGRTVVFVSHNMEAVRSLCSRVLLLDRGRLCTSGPPEDVIGRYLDTRVGGRDHWLAEPEEVERKPVFAFREAAIRRNESGHELQIRYVVKQPRLAALVAVRLDTETYSPVTVVTDADGDARRFHKTAGEYEARLRLPTHLLAPGSFHLTLSCSDMKDQRYDYQEAVLSLETRQPPEIQTTFPRLGPLLAPLSWTVQRVG